MKKTPNKAPALGLSVSRCLLALAAGLSMSAGAQVPGAGPTAKPVVTKGTVSAASSLPAAGGSMDFALVGPAMELVIGKSTLLRLPSPVERISVGNPNIADISLISPVELYLLGKNYGATNLVIWRKGAPTTAIDVNVNIDAERMERKLRELLPDEAGIRVRPAADSVILTGVVSSAVKARQAEEIAQAFVRDINRNLVLPVVAGDGRVAAGTVLGGGSATAATASTVGAAGAIAGARVVNLLQVAQGQQVMLEVKVAEVSKSLLDKLGVNLTASAGNGGLNYSILSNLLAAATGVFNITTENGNRLTVDASKTDGLFKVLAEPNIISISGQEASFLAGGKIFVPVVTGGLVTGGTAITLQEKEFGVGVKFTPTVLEGGRIHLKVAPEVSELGKSITIGSGSSQASLPSFTTRRVQTTVQLVDGQSLAIAGLIKNNVTENISRVPLLGDLPVLGALFRSSEFQNDRSELVFLITPRLVKPQATPAALPTDGFIPPNRSEFFFGGKLEGSGRADVPPDRREPAAVPAVPAPAAPAQAGGFESK